MKPKVLVILGTTSSGKSDLAVYLAKKVFKNKAEVISADSRQVYKGLDIGTGKITAKEMQGVPHWGLDVINPKNKFSVLDFKNLANRTIEEIVSKGKTPIICGGTGFYIDAVVNNIVLPEVTPNKLLRKQLEHKSTEDLVKILTKLDKNRAKSIDTKNRVRLIRAIEICKALGKVPNIKRENSEYDFIKIGTYLEPQELKLNIEKRVKKMFTNGLIKEIQKLKKQGVSKKRLAEFGFEYNNPTIESVINGSTKYAKRQLTWFKRDKTIKWMNPKDKKEIEKYIISSFEKFQPKQAVKKLKQQ